MKWQYFLQYAILGFKTLYSFCGLQHCFEMPQCRLLVTIIFIKNVSLMQLQFSGTILFYGFSLCVGHSLVITVYLVWQTHLSPIILKGWVNGCHWPLDKKRKKYINKTRKHLLVRAKLQASPSKTKWFSRHLRVIFTPIQLVHKDTLGWTYDFRF